MQLTVITIVCLLSFYTIPTVFQLYHGDDMIYEMSRRKLKPTLLPTQWIFNLHIGMVWEELAFLWWRYKLYTAEKRIAAQLNVIAMTGIRTPVPRVTYPAL